MAKKGARQKEGEYRLDACVPLRETEGVVFGNMYRVREFAKALEITPKGPEEGDAVFILDKEICRSWRRTLPYGRTLVFPSITQPGVMLARVGSSGGYVLPEEDETWYPVYEQGRVKAVSEYEDVPITTIDWELLPPDQTPWPLAKDKEENQKEEQEETDLEREERLAFLAMMRPDRWYRGIGKGDFRRRVYYAAHFAKPRNIVIADAPTLGNALYWLDANRCQWQQVLSQTKRCAVQMGAHKIIHKGDWQGRTISIIQGT